MKLPCFRCRERTLYGTGIKVPRGNTNGGPSSKEAETNSQRGVPKHRGVSDEIVQTR